MALYNFRLLLLLLHNTTCTIQTRGPRGKYESFGSSLRLRVMYVNLGTVDKNKYDDDDDDDSSSYLCRTIIIATSVVTCEPCPIGYMHGIQ